MDVMAIVCSEVGEDYFLQGIGNNLFTDGGEEEEEEEPNTSYTETTFEMEASNPETSNKTITIEHSTGSSVDLVGLQVWRGALLLADFLLSHPEEVQGRRVVELAAGTGLTAVVAATLAAAVTATDVDRGDILALLGRNAGRNLGLMANPAAFAVMELDFFQQDWPVGLARAVEGSEVVLAADVVYNRDITKHFFLTLRRILAAPRVALLAIERRQSDPRDSATTFASNFSYFEHELQLLQGEVLESGVEVEVKQVDTTFPQHFAYTRVQELTLWRVTSS